MESTAQEYPVVVELPEHRPNTRRYIGCYWQAVWTADQQVFTVARTKLQDAVYAHARVRHQMLSESYITFMKKLNKKNLILYSYSPSFQSALG